jgi:hypothetical protein
MERREGEEWGIVSRDDFSLLASDLRASSDAELEARREDLAAQRRQLEGKPGRKARNGRRAFGRAQRLIAAELGRRRRRAYAIAKASERQAARNRDPLRDVKNRRRSD